MGIQVRHILFWIGIVVIVTAVSFAHAGLRSVDSLEWKVSNAENIVRGRIIRTGREKAALSIGAEPRSTMTIEIEETLKGNLHNEVEIVSPDWGPTLDNNDRLWFINKIDFVNSMLQDLNADEIHSNVNDSIRLNDLDGMRDGIGEPLAWTMDDEVFQNEPERTIAKVKELVAFPVKKIESLKPSPPARSRPYWFVEVKNDWIEVDAPLSVKLSWSNCADLIISVRLPLDERTADYAIRCIHKGDYSALPLLQFFDSPDVRACLREALKCKVFVPAYDDEEPSVDPYRATAYRELISRGEHVERPAMVYPDDLLRPISPANVVSILILLGGLTWASTSVRRLGKGSWDVRAIGAGVHFVAWAMFLGGTTVALTRVIPERWTAVQLRAPVGQTSQVLLIDNSRVYWTGTWGQGSRFPVVWSATSPEYSIAEDLRFSKIASPRNAQRFGVGSTRRVRQPGNVQTQIRYAWAPAWAVATVLMAPFGVGFAMELGRKLRGRRRRERGLCEACGYDLRMTPDLCPECGYVPKKPAIGHRASSSAV